MKRFWTVFISALLIFSLAACGNSQTEPPAEENEAQKPETTSSRILIAYFTMPEDVVVSGAGADALSGASIVVKDNKFSGSMEYAAEQIQKTIGGDLFRIETKQQYPQEHEPLVDQASEEQSKEARPELSTHIDNPDQYDTILLGYPIWWGDMPQPLYTFLEEYDFGGKTIIPFVTHGGSGMAGTQDKILQLQPNAIVSGNTLCISRDDIAESEKEIRSWAESLGVKSDE